MKTLLKADGSGRALHLEDSYKKISIFYILLMGIYQMADKMYGSGFVAFMNAGGLTAVQIGFVLSFQDLALAVFDYPSGNLADRHGRKKTGSAGLLIWGISLITFGLSSSFVHFLLSSLLMAIGLALFSGSHFSWYIDELIRLNKYEFRAKILPWNRGIIMSFSVAGALLASYLVRWNIQTPLIVAGILAIAGGIISFLVFQDNYGEGAETRFFRQLHFNTRQFARDKAMKIILAKNIFSTFGFSIFILYWQLYAVNVLKLDYRVLGIVLIGMTLILTVSNFIVSYLTKFFDNYRITILGEVLVIAGFAVLSFQGSLLLFFTGIILLELGLGIDGASMNTWVQDHIGSQNRSSYNSALSSLGSLTGFVMLLVSGLIVDHVAPSFIWLMAGAGGAFSLGVLILYAPFLRKHADVLLEKQA
ncbi:MFS transporter [Paenibacillus tepidiphilus]|uniref:MFS transporter n=1 Tax=Paenibacillus tepidiphilus TaxID=2608683 RepID=UPI001239B318|nr:MFS transporter [Paenibacillus tepidiphilus]